MDLVWGYLHSVAFGWMKEVKKRRKTTTQSSTVQKREKAQITLWQLLMQKIEKKHLNLREFSCPMERMVRVLKNLEIAEKNSLKLLSVVNVLNVEELLKENFLQQKKESKSWQKQSLRSQMEQLYMVDMQHERDSIWKMAQICSEWTRRSVRSRWVGWHTLRPS